MTAITGIHPYARRYRMRSDDELLDLGADIKDNGQRVPITLTPDGLLLDGRQRARACELVGLEPVAEVTDVPESEWAFLVLSLNSQRRHDTPGQNVMSAALVLSDSGRRKKGRWVGWSRTSDFSPKSESDAKAYNRAGIVLDFAPDLAEQVVSGVVALTAAYDQAIGIRDKERNRLAMEDRIKAEDAEMLANLPAKYRDQIPAKYPTPRQANAAWEDDDRADAARRRQEKELKERKAREELDNHRQACRHETESLTHLLAYIYPEARHRFLTEHWRLGADGASPSLRGMHSPERIREVIAGLILYADELENQQ